MFNSSIIENQDKGKIIILFIAMVLSTCLEIVGLGLIPAYIYMLSSFENIYDKLPIILNFFQKYDEKNMIIIFSISLVLFFLIKNIILILIYKSEAKIISKLVSKNASKIFSYYISNNLEFHHRNNPSTLIKNLSQTNNEAGELIRILINIIKEISLIIFIVAIMLYVNFKITFLVLLSLTFFTFIFYFILKKPLVKMGRESQIHQEKQIKILNHSFQGIREIKIFQLEDKMKKLFNVESYSWINKQNMNGFYSRLPRIFFEILAIFLIIVIMTSLIIKGKAFETILPLLTLYAVTLIRLIPSFSLVSSSLGILSYYKEAYKIINIVLGKLSLNIENKKNLQIDNLNFVNNDIDNIKFSDVSFHYLSRRENKVINNLSLEFHKGEIVGIFGKSGRGKSTILDLLMGLINPINGKILYNNQDIKENSINLSKIVGYVSQNVYLFDDTLKKNITFLDNDLEDKKRLLSAISHAQLNDFIEKMPSKILTNVGNMGSNLSGGQIQRIGIARALYKNPEIIIFDEATNSLDKESEKQILSKFKDPVFSKKIIFLVSHDPKIISYCNRAIIIKKDLVTEDLNLNQIKNLSEQKIIEIL